MADLYRAVRSPRPALRRDGKLFASIALAVILGLAALTPLFFSMRYQLNYRELLVEFSQTTVAAFTAQDTTVERDGVTRPLSGSGCHQLYELISDADPGRWRDPPEEPAPITVRYGDGAVLELWEDCPEPLRTLFQNALCEASALRRGGSGEPPAPEDWLAVLEDLHWIKTAEAGTEDKA